MKTSLVKTTFFFRSLTSESDFPPPSRSRKTSNHLGDMSWDPNAGASSYDEAGGYGNYGNYSEQPQQQFPAGDGKANATESSYDMFGANAGYGGGGGQQSQV